LTYFVTAMHEDNIESLWRKVMHTSADNCSMEFAAGAPFERPVSRPVAGAKGL
jgi:hypothetical protein